LASRDLSQVVSKVKRQIVVPKNYDGISTLKSESTQVTSKENDIILKPMRERLARLKRDVYTGLNKVTTKSKKYVERALKKTENVRRSKAAKKAESEMERRLARSEREYLARQKYGHLNQVCPDLRCDRAECVAYWAAWVDPDSKVPTAPLTRSNAIRRKGKKKKNKLN